MPGALPLLLCPLGELFGHLLLCDLDQPGGPVFCHL